MAGTPQTIVVVIVVIYTSLSHYKALNSEAVAILPQVSSYSAVLQSAFYVWQQRNMRRGSTGCSASYMNIFSWWEMWPIDSFSDAVFAFHRGCDSLIVYPMMVCPMYTLRLLYFFWKYDCIGLRTHSIENVRFYLAIFVFFAIS